MALAAEAQELRTLTDGWEFRRVGGSEWRQATVPGVVHTDLMAHGLIPDPFVGENERLVQWVDKEDWEYRTTFTIDSLHRQTDLIFEGLDTYADVWVNDSLLLQADNMFRTYEVPLNGIARQGVNTLKILFHSPIKTDIPKYDALPYHLEAGNDQSERGGVFDKKVSVFARKAGYHYGWDWGPRLVTSGIWRNVILREVDDPYIKDAHIQTVKLSKDKAEMLATIEIHGAEASRLRIEGFVDGQLCFSSETKNSTIEIPFTVRNPKLWWCNGLGEPHLYDFTISIGSDSKTVRTGIRTIELVRDDGAFYFRLNGQPVFAKGANYIPCDSFLPRVSDETYRRTVQDAADANMNMLRVWGGGVYEADRFYELCDSLGIMVWQDFMFACSLYPADKEFLQSVEAEAVDNVKRLRNHPCISLWCGNNECLEAWYCWGYKRNYERQGVADIIWQQYCDLFHTLLPRVVREHTDVAYHASSPMSRPDGRPEPERGDYHFWTVWGGDAPTSDYADFKARFFSEYGFQSFPELSTIKRFTSNLYANSDDVAAHQRCPVGNAKLFGYLEREMPEPKDFESMIYMSQLLQADAIRTAIEAHRCDAPHCMGSLFWQHNDCWPVASWSSRDYYGNWKAQHYFARKAYADTLLTIEQIGDSIHISRAGFPACDLSGEKSQAGKPALQVITATRTLTDSVFAVTPADQFVAVSVDGKYENIRLLQGAALQEPNIDLQITPAEGGYDLTVTADTFVRALAFFLEDGQGRFSDNFIDLLPGRPATIRLLTTKTPEEITAQLTTINLKSATRLTPINPD